MTEQVTITEVRNARSMNETNTVIDVEINHPEHGWIPYLLTDYDECTHVNNDEVMSLIGTNFEAYVPLTQEELDLLAAGEVRRERHVRLTTEVDPLTTNALRWSQLTTEQQNAWAAYRTALLDITDQAGFPHSVTWPTKPE